MTADPNVDISTLTPIQARDRLASLTADKDWSGKLLAGDGATRLELDALIERKLAADPTDAVMSGTAQPQPFETLMPGEISTANLVSGVQSLREIGIEDIVIKAFLNKTPI